MSIHLSRSECEDETRVKRRTAHKDRGRIGFPFVFACVVGKNSKTPIRAPWLMTLLHGCLGSPVHIYGVAQCPLSVQTNRMLRNK